MQRRALTLSVLLVLSAAGAADPGADTVRSTGDAAADATAVGAEVPDPPVWEGTAAVNGTAGNGTAVRNGTAANAANGSDTNATAVSSSTNATTGSATNDTPGSISTANVSMTDASDGIEIVVHNLTSNLTRRYNLSGPVEGGSGSRNADEIADDRAWVRNDTQYAPWDPEFSSIVSLSGCTGALVSEYHVLTAAHCVYDGDSQDWVGPDINVAPGTEQVGAEDTAPYGTAETVLIRTYAPFVDSSDPVNETRGQLNDLALLTLDRRIGVRAGTLDFAYEGNTTVNQSVYEGHRVDVAGYPAPPPADAAPIPSLWTDHGNTTGAVCETRFLIFTNCRKAGLVYDVATGDGQSGAPVIHNPPWASSGEFLTDRPTILAVHAYGRETGDGADVSGWGPRITPNRSDHIESWIATDERSGDGDFAHRSAAEPVLSFASVATHPPKEWYDWERTEPKHTVVNGSTWRYEREVVNVGSERFNGTVTLDVTSRAMVNFTVSESVDSLAPGESVTVSFERRVTGIGDAGLEIDLLAPEGGSLGPTTGIEPHLTVRPDDDEWYGRYYDARRSNANPNAVGPDGPGITAAWNATLDGNGATGVAVADRRAYTVTDAGSVYAINTETGESEWRTAVADPEEEPVRKRVAAGHGNVYVGLERDDGTNATVFALNPADGTVEWTADARREAVTDFAVAPSHLYARSEDRNGSSVLRLAPATGTRYGHKAFNDTVFEFATVGDQRLVVAQSDEVAGYAVRNRSTIAITEQWSADAGTVTAGLTVDDEFLFVHDGQRTLSAVDYRRAGTSARTVWEFSAPNHLRLNHSPAVVGDRLILGDTNGTVYALSTANGTERWTRSLRDGVRRVVAANATVYVTTDDNTVYALDAADGAVRWSESVRGSRHGAPAVVGAQAILPTEVNGMSSVVALRASAPRATFEYAPTRPGDGDEVTFNASASTGTGSEIATYEWDLDGDGDVDATGKSVSHAFETPGNHSVSLAVTTEEGATDTTSRTVSVVDAVVPRFTHSPARPVVTPQDENEDIPEEALGGWYAQDVTLNASNSTSRTGNITSYKWAIYEDDRQPDYFTRTKTGQSVSFEPARETNISVDLTVTTENGSTETRNRVIETRVNRNPVNEFTVEPGSPTLGDTVTLNATRTRDGDDDIPDEITDYEWEVTPRESSGTPLGAELDGYTTGENMTYTFSGFLPESRESVSRTVELATTDEYGGSTVTSRGVAVDVPDDLPTLAIGNATVTEGESVTVPVVLSAAPDGVGRAELTVSSDNESVASVSNLGTSSYAFIYDNRIEIYDSFYANEFRPGDTNVTLFTITLTASEPGTADVNVTAIRDFGGDNGVPQSGIIEAGSVTVTPEPPVEVNATLGTERNNAGSPLEVVVNASANEGNVTNVTLSNASGETLGTAGCETPAPNCTVRVAGTLTEATWNGTGYEARTFAVTVANDAGETVTETVSVRVYAPGDANGDGAVDVEDAAVLGQSWGTAVGEPAYDPAADLTNDGAVDIFDAVVVGTNWGQPAAESVVTRSNVTTA